MVSGLHIQDNIVEPTAGMPRERRVDGTEGEQNHCRSRAEDYVAPVGSHIAVDCILAVQARELERQLDSGIRHWHERLCVEDIPVSRCL